MSGFSMDGRARHGAQRLSWRSSARAAYLGAALAALLVAHAEPARAQQCRVVELQMTPAAKLQIVAWIEDLSGTYIDTVYITNATGLYGIGNRPGILEFNSGPNWPYGRRENVFPVWSHRHGKSFPAVVFQNNSERDLSHPADESSAEPHYFRPLDPTKAEWDAVTFPSTVYTDKGVFSSTSTSRYPPRSDLQAGSRDSMSVEMYRAMNPFDTVSRATPAGDVNARLSWPIPTSLQPGNYVMWVEVSKEFDHNTTYSVAARPAPSNISYGDFGRPYRGQPSVVYKVPFTLAATLTTAQTSAYIGYGDPDGIDGTVRAPDGTITTNTPGSGAARLALVPDGASNYRLKVTARPEFDSVAPGMPAAPQVTATKDGVATLIFEAPGEDGAVGRVTEYEVRVRAGEPITEANFESSMPVSAQLEPDDPGQQQTVKITGLLPATHYWVGVRAFDDCRNAGPLMVVDLNTAEKKAGEVDACFVATAAYGSLMANEVTMLRRFRDTMLSSSVLGELAVSAYYTFGPTVAGVVGESELLRSTARSVLDPVVKRVGTLQK
jgi:hypothetical protein